MLDQVKEIGLKMFDGNEAAAQEFVDSFVKEASDRGLDVAFNEGVGSAVGKGLGGTMVGLALSGFNRALGNVRMGGLHNQYMAALEHAIATTPLLQQADRNKVLSFGETIFKFAPHVATDANLLSSILAHSVQGEMVDSNIIRTLTDLEARYVDTHATASFSPKTYV